jgi:hypothetical protein
MLATACRRCAKPLRTFAIDSAANNTTAAFARDVPQVAAEISVARGEFVDVQAVGE